MAFVQRRFSLQEGMKLFLFLMRQFGISQREAQQWIDKGRVEIDGVCVKHKGAVARGEVSVLFFEPISKGIAPLFVAPDFALFDKPPSMLVHPKGRFLHHSLMDEVRGFFGSGANIVHRIDQETSGLVLAARHKRAERALKILFEHKEVQKSYWALVRGRVGEARDLNYPLVLQDKHTDLGVRVKVDVARGKESLTQILPLDYDARSDTTLLEAIPLTGRTHQIRIHLAHSGHPIVGDPLYGALDQDSRDYLEQNLSDEARRERFGAPRLMLHAQTLCFAYNSAHYHLASRQDFLAQVRAFWQTFL